MVYQVLIAKFDVFELDGVFELWKGRGGGGGARRHSFSVGTEINVD